jgi:hypothetical protein
MRVIEPDAVLSEAGVPNVATIKECGKGRL